MIDWCAAKGSPGTGLALVQKLAAMFDFMYSIGGSDQTRKVLPAFGFVEVTKAWTAARPLRPLRQILTHQTVNWKLAPRLARNCLWSKSPAADAPGWRTVVITRDHITRTPSTRPSVRMIRFKLSAANGSLGVSRRIRIRSRLLTCQRDATNTRSSTRWARRRPTYTWEVTDASTASLRTCAAGNPPGFEPPPRTWPRPWNGSGKRFDDHSPKAPSGERV